jgi:16S rRNA (cytosine1402-N4)-methyltransferase
MAKKNLPKKIANAIINFRNIKPINTTFDLANLVKETCPAFYGKNKHPATRVFQAIRIFINQELLNLQMLLPELINLLNIGGRIVIISFHSLEDRIVKTFINKYSKNSLANNYALRKLPIVNFDNQDIKLKNLGKIKPSLQEIQNNKRARSAIMRVAEKCA